MKTMKILSIAVFIFSFSQCKSTKFVKNPAFKIDSATYTNWVGGVEGVSGTRVEIKLSEKGTVVFDSLYFRKKATKIEVKENILRAYFNTSTKRNTDFILHSDPKKEFNNKLPTSTKFPFNLKENEAVISYKIGHKINYYKIENIKEIPSNQFPKTQ